MRLSRDLTESCVLRSFETLHTPPLQYVEIWRRVPLEDGILSAPPVPDLAKDYQPPQQGAGLDTVVQFVSNCHASLPHAPISVAEYWQTMLPTSCTIPAGGELLPDYGEVTFDATSMIARCDFIP